MSEYPPYYAYPSTPPLLKAIPTPPRLHWGWVLALNLITRGLFGAVWLLVQANWARKAGGRKTAFVWSIVHVSFFPFFFLAAIAAGVVAGATGRPVEGVVAVMVPLAVVSVLVLYLGTVFALRTELEAEPIGIPLGGGMTFFFGPLYFQYHLRDWNGSQTGSDVGLGLNQPVNYYPPAAVPAQQETALPD